MVGRPVAYLRQVAAEQVGEKVAAVVEAGGDFVQPCLAVPERGDVGDRDYLPDSGRFDVSAPGTPFASAEHSVDLRLLTEATRRRQV